MKILMRSLVTVFAFLFLFGCTSKMNTIPSFDTKQFDAGQYNSKVDNFIILFDASSSMTEKFNGSNKFNSARAIVNGMNATLPELGQTAGLRSFGHAPGVSKKSTVLFYGMEKYSTQNLENSFTKINQAGGLSPLFKAFNEAGNDLKGLAGERNAVIIITDGLDLRGDTIAAAKNLKSLYGDSICFFPIHVGDNKKAEVVLKEIANIGGCGFYSKASEMLTYGGMGDFVEMVFLDEKTVAAAPVAPKVVVKKDSDQDGVYDEDDQCPGTPIGAIVNAVGCWNLGNVLFDFNKHVIKTVAYPLLDDVVGILEKNPAMKIDLNGHCDNVGTVDYNMSLSLNRAVAVKNYLVDAGISASRLSTKGFGFTQPVALNGTDIGRSMNRRVELHPY